MNIVVNGKKEVFEKEQTLESISQKLQLEHVLAAKVDGRLRELTYCIKKDCDIEYLTMDDPDAIKIYESTLRYVVAMAVQHLYPNVKLKFSYSISRAILATFENFKHLLSPKIVSQINDEVQKIVDADYKIERHTMALDKAIKLYDAFGMEDKVDILKYREDKDVNYYACDEYINYMFGYMLPSTGYLKSFNMFLYYPGFIIQYPRAELKGEIPTFIDEPNFGRALKDVAKWGKIIDGNTIAKMNQYALNKKSATDFVNMCESKHSHMLHELGDQIEFNIDSIKLIGIAGPSSSGKTTFSNRLRIELMSRGIKPVMISIDDYYLGKEFAPKDDFGQPDLEHVEALDLELFNHDMLKLIQGETVTLPKFNFKTGLREAGHVVKLQHDTPIIIEGIHALNERLTYSIPKHQKYKIYIAPQTQLHIDDLNPISITELRLLRRIVRDQKYRNSSAAMTMDMWSNVRKGEFKWIYPFQNEADYVFNSELTYELAVLKKHAVKQLEDIDRDNEHFITANRLLKFLKYIKDIDDELVPNNSLLREFIGDSCFRE